MVVVAGLPRSGTSLVLRMLEAGGLPVLTDRLRQPDADNPRGYYEFEPVKRTAKDSSWVTLARGKAVKVVYRLLYELPASDSYRVLFLRRRMSEVYASQETMLTRGGKPREPMTEDRFVQVFTEELRRVQDWLGRQPNFAVLEVDYNRLIAEPRPAAEAIDRFLDGGLDLAAMERVVEPGLYRHRG